MGIQQSFLMEIEKETANTRKMIAAIKDENLNFKPHEKSFSMQALAKHIVELHNLVSVGLSKNAIDLEKDFLDFPASTVDELLAALDNGYAANVATIKSIEDAAWMENWTMSYKGQVIASMPKAGAMRFMVQSHLIHHRGQLSLYLRLNDIPVPGVYGPSADEM